MADPLNLDPGADDQKLLAQVVAFYQQALQQSPDALTYLRRRGVSTEAIEHHRIGYADRSLGLQLPHMRTRAGERIRGRLQQLGLYRTSGHEHFAGSVVFPVTAADGTGRIVDIYGRKLLGAKLRKGTALDLYLSEQRQGVWNVEALAASKDTIICPSVFEALVFWCHGYRNVTCTFGADALTEDHLAAFVEFNVQRALVVAETIVPRLMDAGLDCYRLALPRDLSVDAYVAQVSNAADALGAAIRKAAWLGKGKEQPQPATGDEPEPEPMPATVDEPEPIPPAPPSSEPTPIRTDSPVPPAPQESDAEVSEDEVQLTFGNRRYRVRGWNKNLSFDVLRVNILVTNDVGLFVDSIDLYGSKHRRSFIIQAAAELHVEEDTIKKDIGRVLLKLEELQDQHIEASLAPKDAGPQMTDAEKNEALRLLRDPNLLDRIVADLDLVGEHTSKLVGYLAAISRKLDEPLAVVIQSTSAAGKSALMEAVLAFVPPEDQMKLSALTGQSLYYVADGSLRHRILAIAEEAGAERAGYALKLLQSEGELTIASTGKEASTGRLVTQEYRVEGPVMIFLTTTSVSIDEELLNRCLVLTVNEGREQTKAIHQAQRRRQTLEGMLARQDRQQKLTLHRNAQRLLRPLLVTNPYAESLTFLDDKTRCRRDHAKYLTLIRAVALLHQHQRPVRTVEHHGKPVEYIEVTLDDVAVANQLAHEVLGRSLDELPPQTRNLLNLIDAMVTAACQLQGLDRSDYRFSRRDVREHTGWGHSQLAIHLRRLEELEYLLVHRGQRGRSIVYELLYQASPLDQQRSLPGLTDVQHLRCDRPGSGSANPAQIRGTSGPLPGHFRGVENDATLNGTGSESSSAS